MRNITKAALILALPASLSAALFACSNSNSDALSALSDDLTGIEHSDPVALLSFPILSTRNPVR